MTETTSNYPRLWAAMAGRGLSMTRGDFWELDIETELNPLIEMSRFTKEEHDKIWVKKYGAFEVH